MASSTLKTRRSKKGPVVLLDSRVMLPLLASSHALPEGGEAGVEDDDDGEEEEECGNLPEDDEDEDEDEDMADD